MINCCPLPPLQLKKMLPPKYQILELTLPSSLSLVFLFLDWARRPLFLNPNVVFCVDSGFTDSAILFKSGILKTPRWCITCMSLWERHLVDVSHVRLCGTRLYTSFLIPPSIATLLKHNKLIVPTAYKN